MDANGKSEDEMITVWVWHNTPEGEDHHPKYPEWVLYYWEGKEAGGGRWGSLRTDLMEHPMGVEIKALADLAGPDPDYDGDVSDDFTIPKEWWGNPTLIKDRDED